MNSVVHDNEGVEVELPRYDKSRLYYEAHVTLDPLTETQKAGVDSLCESLGWRRSTFEMHKELTPNAFISCRDQSYTSMVERVGTMVQYLQSQGLNVLRWKIEDTCADSNRGDLLLMPLAVGPRPSASVSE